MKCCVSTDVGTWTNWLTFEPDPDYSLDAGTGLFSPISYALQRRILLRRKIPRMAIGRPSLRRPSLQRRVVLKWCYSPRAVGTTLSEVNALQRVAPQNCGPGTSVPATTPMDTITTGLGRSTHQYSSWSHVMVYGELMHSYSLMSSRSVRKDSYVNVKVTATM